MRARQTRRAAPNRLVSARALVAALTPLAVMMCAAVPPEEGVEVRAAGGYNTYTYQERGPVGCYTPTTHTSRVGEVRGYGEVSYRSKSGLSVTAESSVSRGRVNQTEISRGDDDTDRPLAAYQQEGHTWTTMYAAVRPGYHSDVWGVELGPLLYWSGMKQDSEPALLWSVRTWWGRPEVVYVWSQLGSGPGSEGFFPFSAGVGHVSSRLRGEVGMSTTAIFMGPDAWDRFHLAPLLHGQVRVADGLWLGAQVQHIVLSGWSQESGTSGLLTLAFAPGQW